MSLEVIAPWARTVDACVLPGAGRLTASIDPRTGRARIEEPRPGREVLFLARHSEAGLLSEIHRTGTAATGAPIRMRPSPRALRRVRFAVEGPVRALAIPAGGSHGSSGVNLSPFHLSGLAVDHPGLLVDRQEVREGMCTLWAKGSPRGLVLVETDRGWWFTRHGIGPEAFPVRLAVPPLGSCRVEDAKGRPVAGASIVVTGTEKSPLPSARWLRAGVTDGRGLLLVERSLLEGRAVQAWFRGAVSKPVGPVGPDRESVTLVLPELPSHHLSVTGVKEPADLSKAGFLLQPSEIPLPAGPLSWDLGSAAGVWGPLQGLPAKVGNAPDTVWWYDSRGRSGTARIAERTVLRARPPRLVELRCASPAAGARFDVLFSFSGTSGMECAVVEAFRDLPPGRAACPEILSVDRVVLRAEGSAAVGIELGSRKRPPERITLPTTPSVEVRVVVREAEGRPLAGAFVGPGFEEAFWRTQLERMRGGSPYVYERPRHTGGDGTCRVRVPKEVRRLRFEVRRAGYGVTRVSRKVEPVIRITLRREGWLLVLGVDPGEIRWGPVEGGLLIRSMLLRGGAALRPLGERSALLGPLPALPVRIRAGSRAVTAAAPPGGVKNVLLK